MSVKLPVLKSILSCDGIIEKILTLYDLDIDISCRFIRQGLNDTYKIDTKDIVYYLRIYRYNWRTKEDIKSEIKLLNHLSKNKQINLSTPIKKKDGNYISNIEAPEGERYAVLFSSAVGNPSYSLNAKKCSNLGRTLGIIHSESDKLKKLDRLNIDLEHLLDDPLKRLKPYFKNNIEDFHYLENIAIKLSERINKLLTKDKSVFGICHGDFHPGNIFMDEKDKPSVFDFDCFGYGWRAYDISVFLWHLWVFKEIDPKQKRAKSRLWNSFLKGYQEIKPLSKDEIKAAVIFVPIRYIWLLGIHANSCNVWGASYMESAFFKRWIKFIKSWIEHYKILP
ncbi:MAG: phosphotransferase [Candidatus Delongbacteria bacterium]|jgi:Ser/Thr protein kinase RdoA (MazF antagonist)|nr:phosphotransferase [Candidatus Delongbacteria bacterium]